MIHWFQVHRDLPEAWAVMPALLDRMTKFCLDMDTDTDPQDLVELIRYLFMTGDVRLGLWVGISEGVLVGHLLATPEPWGGNKWRFCLIRQAQVDVGIDSRKETGETFEAVKAWTRKLGLAKIKMLTHRTESAMARKWGFQTEKVYMGLDLDREI